MNDTTSDTTTFPRSDTRPVIALTCGEPAGIGPEITLRAAWALRATVNSVLIGDAALLSILAAMVDPALRLDLHSADAACFEVSGPNHLAMIDVPLAVPTMPGELDARNGAAVLETLDIAIAGALDKRFDAIVTAPLQKSTINDAGVAFSGHTEYLADKTGTEQVVMMLAGGPAAHPLRVALATTQLALKDVPAAITFARLRRTLQIVHDDLRSKFGIAQPRILVTGLNPHAGENGYIGREEIDVIQPVLAAAQADGIAANGPYPADTLFQPKYLENADCVLAMYHDQGLPVLKHISLGQGINVTLGLPIIRTSVDHGTALDLAASGFGQADHRSMIEAVQAAARMVAVRRPASCHPWPHS